VRGLRRTDRNQNGVGDHLEVAGSTEWYPDASIIGGGLTNPDWVTS
jgi:hypothetical protein